MSTFTPRAIFQASGAMRSSSHALRRPKGSFERLRHLLPRDVMRQATRPRGTREMIAKLLAHAERTKRMSKPTVKTAIRVYTPYGKTAVQMKIRTAG